MVQCGARQGLGWRNQGWVSATQGYEITNAPALVFSNLMVNTPSGKGGYSFQDAGRTFDTLGALRAYTTPGDLTNIGRSNDEYWVSFLIRRTHPDGQGRVALCRASGSVAWYNDRVAEVYQGAGNWIFQVKGSPQCVITTAVPATVGQTFFMVMRLRLAGNAPSNIVDLYINPSPLGGEPPATPTASLAIATNYFNFARLVWKPGNQPNYGMLDEFRLGTSYAAVTPVWPENVAPEIVTTNVPQGAVGQPYGAVLQAVGGVGNLTRSVAAGGLPTGLELSPLGIIRGTPSVVGTTSILFAVTDETAQAATQAVVVVIVPEPAAVLMALGWLAVARRQ